MTYSEYDVCHHTVMRYATIRVYINISKNACADSARASSFMNDITPIHHTVSYWTGRKVESTGVLSKASTIPTLQDSK